MVHKPLKRHISPKLLIVSTLLLVLAVHLRPAKATDPSVTLRRWINYGVSTPNFPNGYAITAVAVDGQERLWIGTGGDAAYRVTV